MFSISFRHVSRHGDSTGGVHHGGTFGEANPKGQHYGNGLASLAIGPMGARLSGMGGVTFSHALFTGWIGLVD